MLAQKLTAIILNLQESASELFGSGKARRREKWCGEAPEVAFFVSLSRFLAAAFVGIKCHTYRVSVNTSKRNVTFPGQRLTLKADSDRRALTYRRKLRKGDEQLARVVCCLRNSGAAESGPAWTSALGLKKCTGRTWQSSS